MIIKESIGCEEQVEPIVKKEQFESKGVAARIGRFSEYHSFKIDLLFFFEISFL
jgi:hypothetical protein